MDPMLNQHATGNGTGTDYSRRLPAMPSNHALEAHADNRSEDSERRSMEPRSAVRRDVAARKRKSKHRPRREPQPPKPMWPAYAMFAGALLYFFMPFDAIPELLLGPAGYIEDAGLFYAAYRQWKSRKDGNSTPQEFRPRRDERTRRDDYGGPQEPAPPARFYDSAPQEKPGFFARLFKAITYLFTGGGL